jgi:hypothetical protein
MIQARHAPLRVRTRVETSAAPRCLFYDDLAVFKSNLSFSEEIITNSVRNAVKSRESSAFIGDFLNCDAAFCGSRLVLQV